MFKGNGMNTKKHVTRILILACAIGVHGSAMLIYSSGPALAHHSGPGLVSDIKGYGLAVGKSGSIACNDGKKSTLTYARGKLPNYSISHRSGFWKFKRNK